MMEEKENISADVEIWQNGCFYYAKVKYLLKSHGFELRQSN